MLSKHSCKVDNFPALPNNILVSARCHDIAEFLDTLFSDEMFLEVPCGRSTFGGVYLKQK